MKEVIGTAKNIELAIEDGLKKLNASREEVEVDPLEPGSAGFLGFGRRLAQVRVTLRNDVRIRTQVFLRNILRHMNINTEVQILEEDENIHVILGEEASPLIGHRGQTLDALQYLIARYLNEDKDEWRKVVLDIDNYRDRREESLKSMAERLAEQVIRSKRDVRTEPLTAPERRIIHMTLKENTAVTTFSIGEGSRKRVVIASTEKPERRSSSRRGSGGGGGGNRSGSNRGRSGGGGYRRGGGSSGGGRRRGGGGGDRNRSRPETQSSKSE